MPDVMKTVGRYEILREVGRGGMAMVYLARQTDLDRFVALKELGAFHASDPSFAQRFLRESRVAGSLSHPNIVTVHDYFEHDGTPYIAMEYVERGSLRPYVGRMTLAQIGGVLEGLLAGLTHAETQGIVHRDLKPENLMVTADGRVKIADFGIAKATTKMQTGAFLTATGTTVGTPTYMAPEQAMAQDIGPWTDLYSVGCMAFELFTGKVPFHDSDAPMAILLRHVNEPIPPVKSIVPEVDQRISDWIEQLLVKDPTQRTQNANDAWDEFEEILLSLLGPRWRREARLVEKAAERDDGSKPLTPAPFQGTSTGDAPSEEFRSFAWGAPASDTGNPPMYTPPPSDSTPSIPEPVVGPPTPMPSEAVPTPPETEPDPETGFVTFGQPAPPPPTDALIPPGQAPAQPEEAAPAPADEAPAPTDEAPPAAGDAPQTGFVTAGFGVPPVEQAPPAQDSAPAEPAPPADVPPADEEPRAFETYVEPPPSRPPTSEPEPAEAAPPPPADAASADAAPEPPLDDPAATLMPQRLRQEPPPPTPPRPPREDSGAGSRRWAVPAAIAGGVAVAAVAGVVLLGGGGEDPPPAPTPQPTQEASTEPTIPVAAAGVSAKVPEGWSEAGAAEEPGMAEGAILVNGPDGESLVLGNADESAANSTLLPDAARTGDVPEKQVFEIGDGLQAARYDGLQIDGDTVNVYAVPTTEGVATLGCVADAEVCATIASTLRITEGKAFPVGPSDEYLGDVESALKRLESREKSAARELNRAGRRQTQVSATNKLASAYKNAARTLGRLEVSPADAFVNAQLVKALNTAGNAYGRAAREGRSKDRNGYKREGSKALGARDDMRDALQGLEAAGYELPSSLARDAAAFTRLPTLKKDPVKKSTPSGGGSAPSTGSSTPPSTGSTTPPSTGGGGAVGGGSTGGGGGGSTGGGGGGGSTGGGGGGSSSGGGGGSSGGGGGGGVSGGGEG